MGSKALPGWVFCSILYTVLLSTTASAESPRWTRENGIKQNGSALTVVSSGVGPSLDLARRAAIDQAKATAADQVNGSADIRSLSIETEKSASFHSEVSSIKRVNNLVCNPKDDYFEEKNGSFTVWLKCEFDLSKSRVVTITEGEGQIQKQNQTKNDQAGDKSIVAVDGSFSQKAPLIGKSTTGEDRHLVLSVVPACESILVRGKQSRTIHCKGNPVTVLVFKSDTEMIVRGPAGFAPKHLKVHEKRTDTSPTETLEVYLEKM